MRAAAYTFHRHAYNFNTGSVDKYDPTLQQFIRGNVLKDTLNEDVAAIQADLLAHFWIDDHKIEGKTLLTFDRSANWRYRIQTQPNTKVNVIPNISTATPNYALPADDAFNIITRQDHVRWDITGVFLRQQTTFLDGRLLTFAGVRYDYVDYDLRYGNQYNTGGSNPGSLKTPGTTDVFADNALTHGLGANFKLTPHFTLYGNHSTSFYPNAQVAKLGDPRLPSETGARLGLQRQGLLSQGQARLHPRRLLHRPQGREDQGHQLQRHRGHHLGRQPECEGRRVRLHLERERRLVAARRLRPHQRPHHL